MVNQHSRAFLMLILSFLIPWTSAPFIPLGLMVHLMDSEQNYFTDVPGVSQVNVMMSERNVEKSSQQQCKNTPFFQFRPTSSIYVRPDSNKISADDDSFEKIALEVPLVSSNDIPAADSSETKTESEVSDTKINPYLGNEEFSIEEERYIVRAIPKKITKTPADSPEEFPEAKSEVDKDEYGDVAANGSEILNQTESRNLFDENVDSNTSEPEIPSFREWAQKTLEEEQKRQIEERRKKEAEKEKKKMLLEQQQRQLKHEEKDSENRTATHLHKHGNIKGQKKNYASLDCGAKVVGANPESQGSSNIISNSRDEYMLNKCSDNAWFIVELCESIKALKIELANFELYSSVPHQFRVSMVNHLPARDRDWILFGEFEAEEIRTIQTFKASEGVLGKYVKVEILSHHGTEHFCPISLFRIYGISEIELIGQDDDDDDDHDHDIHLDLDDHHSTEDNKKVPDLVSFIKEKVDATIQTVVGVFRAKDRISSVNMSVALESSSLIGNSFKYVIKCPGCDEDRQKDVFFMLATNYRMLSKPLAKQPLLKKALESGICEKFGFDSVDNGTFHCLCFHSKLLDLYETFFGTSSTIALCNVIAIEHSKLEVANDGTEWATTVISGSLGIDGAEEFHPASQENRNSTNEATGEQLVTPENPESNEQQPDEDAPKQHGDNDGQDREKAKDQHRVDDSLSKPKEEKKEPSKKAGLEDQSEVESSSEARPDTGSSNEMRDPPKVVHVTPSSTSHISSSISREGGKAQVDNQGKPAPPVQKESVWQKLSNKIKNLELNVTLSSGYLEELSVRYKKQIEDLQLSARQTSENLESTSSLAVENRGEIDKLRVDLNQVKESVEEMFALMESLGTWAIGLHLLFILVEVIIGILFIFVCFKKARPGPFQKVAPSQSKKSNVKMANAKANNAFLMLESTRKHKTELRRSSFDAALYANGDLKGLSKRQRKRLQKKLLRRGTSTGKLNDLPHEGDFGYHTYHPGQFAWYGPEEVFQMQPKKKGLQGSKDSNLSQRRMKSHAQHRQSEALENGIDSDDSMSETDIPSRFKITPTPLNSKDISPYPLLNGRHVPLKNKFSVLNHSVHDDPSPENSPVSNGHRPYVEIMDSQSNQSGIESSDDQGQPRVHARKSRHTLKLHHRSKSTSPKRVGQAEKQRDILKKFDPDKAEWIKK